MSFHSPAETIDSHGCSVTLRCVEGPEALELFFQCSPPVDLADAGSQAAAMYRAIHEVLQARGGSMASIVSEMVSLRDLAKNIKPVRDAREQVLAASGVGASAPAITEVEQPPINTQACLEILGQAIVAGKSTVTLAPVTVSPACDCQECARAHGLKVQLTDETRVLIGGLCGAGSNAYQQTHSMFEQAEAILQQAGFEFTDVVRTWIHLGEMERDYHDLNQARREFFAARGIDPVPASTGIGGGPVSERHDLCLTVYAVKGVRSLERTVMTSPTLNEARQYGADFVRGMRINESNKQALLVSGTASVDEAGHTAHVGDFDAQADRMLVNVAALLKGQGASFADIVSAITYVKHPEDASRLREKLHQAGFEGFPNVIVEALVCRADLLCETEVLAVQSTTPV